MRQLDVAVGRGLGALVLHRGRRCLAGGEAVDLVIHDDVGEIEVAAHGVDEVADADAVAVAIAAGDDHLEIGVGQLDAGGHRDSASMQGVHAVGVHIAGQVGGAADAGDDDQVL